MLLNTGQSRLFWDACQHWWFWKFIPKPWRYNDLAILAYDFAGCTNFLTYNFWFVANLVTLWYEQKCLRMQNFGQTTPMWTLRSAIWSSAEENKWLITQSLALMNCLATVRNTKVAVDETELLLTFFIAHWIANIYLILYKKIWLSLCRSAEPIKNFQLGQWTFSKGCIKPC